MRHTNQSNLTILVTNRRHTSSSTIVIHRQGVVTYASPVEAFATGIKIESSNQCSFLELIMGSRQILSD